MNILKIYRKAAKVDPAFRIKIPELGSIIELGNRYIDLEHIEKDEIGVISKYVIDFFNSIGKIVDGHRSDLRYNARLVGENLSARSVRESTALLKLYVKYRAKYG